MDRERWRRVEELYHSALKVEPDQLASFLESHCGNDPTVRREVESLLGSGDSFLEEPAFELAARQMAKDSAIPIPGSTVGNFHVLEKIGEGGMGVVFKAQDLKLRRKVALKFLSGYPAGDPQALARFRREAQAASALNHPNIATIYGFEEHGGALFLIMELIQGPMLSDRIAEGPIALHDSLRIAHQIAQALEAAHEKNIIHRDLKPANIRFTPEGEVKLLDFGLAKALENDIAKTYPSASPIGSQAATLPGTVLGTAAYMAPEQAKSQHNDKRADIWAFGAVLYEMLTAKQAFGAETVMEMLACVIHGEPDWNALPQETPEIILRLLRRCLEKDAKQRLRDIGDARMDIEEALANPAGGGSVAPSEVARARPTWRRFLPWVLATCLAAVAAAALWSPWRRTESPRAKRFTITTQDGGQLVPGGGGLVISRDGSYVVYVGAGFNGDVHLYRRRMDRDQSDQLRGTQDAESPIISPDGRWIAFKAHGKLLKVDAEGGTSITLCDVPGARGLGWSSDRMIYFTDPDGNLFRVPDTGGKPQLVVIPKGSREPGLRQPYALPGGRALLLVTGGGVADPNGASILAFNLVNGQSKELIRGGAAPRYAPTGHLVYAQRGRLLAVSLDIRRLELTGSAAPILENVWQGPGGNAAYDISEEGTLVFAKGGESLENRQIVWVDRKGKEQPIRAPEHSYIDMRLSPDGRRIAVATVDADSPHDIWVLNQESPGSATLITHAKPGESHRGPVWTPDGKSLLYSKQGPAGSQILRMAADGSGEEELLYKDRDDQASLIPEQCSPDARLLIFRRFAAAGPTELWKVPLAGSHEAQPLFRHALPINRSAGQISPDGRWMAYVSLETGPPEVYLAPYPNVDSAKWRISTDGGQLPRWSRDGRELYYSSNFSSASVRLFAVEIHTSSTIEKGLPQLLFEGPYPHIINTIDYDADPRGQRFILLKPRPSTQQPAEFHVVLNWTEELKSHLNVQQK